MSISAVMRMEAHSNPNLYPLISSQAATANPNNCSNSSSSSLSSIISSNISSISNSSNISNSNGFGSHSSHSRISPQGDKFVPPHCLADAPFSASPIMDVLSLDEEFDEVEKAHFVTFYRICEQQMLPTHQTSEEPSQEHDTFFDATSRADIDLNIFPKEGLFIQALWVIYLSTLKKVLTLKEYKYQTMEAFWSQYSNAFSNIDQPNSHATNHHPIRLINATESINLFHTANWMAIMFKIIPARKNKGFSINVVPKLVEGWNVKYITGSGQKTATIFRVVIFQTEGHVIPFHRGQHNKELTTASTMGGGGDSKRAVPNASSKNSSNSNSSSNNTSFSQRSSSINTNILPAPHLFQSSALPPSLSISNIQLISSSTGTIVDSDDDGQLNKKRRSSNEAENSRPTSCDGLSSEGESWEKNCGLFKKSDVVLEKHGNHGFRPVCNEKKEKLKREHREISNSGSRSSSRSCISNSSSSENFGNLLQLHSISPPFRDSFTDLMMDGVDDYANLEQPGTLSRDVSEILKNNKEEEEESLNFSVFDRVDLSLFDDGIPLPISTSSTSSWRDHDHGDINQGKIVNVQVPIPASNNNSNVVKSGNLFNPNMSINCYNQSSIPPASGDNALSALMLFK